MRHNTWITRIAAYALMASLAFIGGWLAHPRFASSNPTHAGTEIIHVSVADLETEPTLYHGKVVSVHGVLTGNRMGDVFLTNGSRSDKNSRDSVPIYVSENRSFSPLPAWAGYASFCGNDRYASMVDGLEADVVVTGTFDGAQIVPSNVLQLSSPAKR